MSESIEIKRAYLMWVGSQHYPDIATYIKEAKDKGVSKRLPNESVASKMMAPGTVIFLAHDEGNSIPCSECEGDMENPNLRIAQNQVAIQQRRCMTLEAELNELRMKDEPDAVAVKRAEGFVQRAETKHGRMVDALSVIPSRITGSTGGGVTIDGIAWDYLRYNYWLHQAKKWKPDDHEVTDKNMCKHCGGKGNLPLGKVFGMILPSAIEYVMRPEDDAAVRTSLESRGFRVIGDALLRKEPPRGCGRRKPGGYYAVTDEEAKRAASDTIKALTKSGALKSEVEMHGDFAEFISPVEIPGVKRFRGPKLWALGPDVETEAEMIMEAAS